ncbi:MAG: hypothetical protein IMF11_19585 [Proteobacteria bacterium]|nr:hypothetical protein [Pseudomonadota bacterium]
MKSKNISILLFILVFAGVALLGHTQVWAEINLGDGICSDQERTLNLCCQDCEYVIEVLLCDDGSWPCVTPEGYKEFRYQAFAPQGCDCDTWNYTVTQLQICDDEVAPDEYIVGSIPSGASLSIPNCKVSKCDVAVEPHPEWGACNEGYQAWKLNPTLNCSEGGYIQFSIIVKADAGVSCGNPTWIRTKSGCTEGCLLRGPGCEDLPTDVGSFQIESWGIIRDPCTGEPVEITSGGEQVEAVIGWLCDDGCNPIEKGMWDETENPTGCKCYKATNIGPFSTGCLFKCNPDRYGYGGSLYSR